MTALPSQRQLTVIFSIVVILLIALGVIAPHATKATSGTEILLPAYAGAVCIIEITTGALLLAMFRVQRNLATLLLAAGYLISGLMVPAWALSFPGVFEALGLQAGLQATAWVAVARRIAFALAVLGYALSPMRWRAETPRPWIAGILACAGLVFIISVWLVVGPAEPLPALMADRHTPGPAWSYVPPLILTLYGAALVALLRRRHASLDIWMTVVILSLTVELILLSYLADGVRLSIGWWSGRVFGLFAAGIILIVVLSETAGNYFRLAEAAAAELRARRNRLTAMEALSASIAHEVNQPLASMVTNANAGMRWLSRPVPDIEQAKAALGRIVDDGHRADRVVSGIRTMFLKGAQERASVDLKCMIGDALSRCRSERTLKSIEIVRDDPSDGVFVTCNATQVLQVCINLIENAVDAMASRPDLPRLLAIVVRSDGEQVTASFADTGPGVPAELADRMFEPFVSTKAGGMGMGLMFCRTVIEAHGGRLNHRPNRPHGAVFEFVLPASPIKADTSGVIRP